MRERENPDKRMKGVGERERHKDERKKKDRKQDTETRAIGHTKVTLKTPSLSTKELKGDSREDTTEYLINGEKRAARNWDRENDRDS